MKRTEGTLGPFENEMAVFPGLDESTDTGRRKTETEERPTPTL